MTHDFNTYINVLSQQAHAWSNLATEQARSIAKLQTELLSDASSKAFSSEKVQAAFKSVSDKAFECTESALKLAQEHQNQVLDVLSKNESIAKVAPDILNQIRDLTNKSQGATNDLMKKARNGFAHVAKASK